MKIEVLGFEFTTKLWAFSLYLLLLSGLISLGCWQLDRAEQKRAFLVQQQVGHQAPIINLNQSAIGARYQVAEITGHYDAAHSFLIDNQVVDGKPGYFVLTPFILDKQEQAVLVNRGWVPLTANRQQLPDVSTGSEIVAIRGRINQFPSVGYKLAGGEIPTETWPAVVQFVDSQVLSAKLAYPVYDFQIELDDDQAAGFVRHWHTQATIPPEKHQAYAVQWFGLAATLTGLFIWISTRKRREHSA
ncbi:MAG: SURF1 family protein [Methylomonas sp.]